MLSIVIYLCVCYSSLTTFSFHFILLNQMDRFDLNDFQRIKQFMDDARLQRIFLNMQITFVEFTSEIYGALQKMEDRLRMLEEITFQQLRQQHRNENCDSNG
ncbi:hypothetical protein T02_13483 [Trichinella nativa]|uniref:Uncharacterized protein n=2 Tax=Trichinella TaxID=6333 RepID=A0A0V1LDG2_9BILA|nr:hypothetical protein T05_11352 [Trichinella murrelli]KRZ57561.1 hypothetical protein T02_13483 [Trichinella nativa]